MSQVVNWKPDEQGLVQVLDLLIKSRKGSSEVQKECLTKLTEFNNTVPDFNNYLAYIFTKCKEIEVPERQAAGLILKANLKQKLVFLEEPAKEHIKQLLLEALTDESEAIRNTSGTIITFILYSDGIENWMNCIQLLLTLLTSNNQNAVEGSLNAIVKVCEDNYAQFVDEQFSSQLNLLLPALIRFMEHPLEHVRRNSLSAILKFFQLEPLPKELLNFMENYLTALFQLANDPSERIRKYVCRAFVMLLDTPNYLTTAINTVIDYMIHCTASKNEELSLEACEFWTVFLDLEPQNPCQQFYSNLQNYLPQLVPVLMDNVIYTEEEQEQLILDSEAPYKDTDINPANYFVRPKGAIDTHYGNEGDVQDDEEDEGDEDDSDWEYDDFEGEDKWTVRKCSATTIDLLSNIYGSTMLQYLLPIIESRMKPELPWAVKESAILSLGAVSNGSMTGMLQYLPTLIPYLKVLLDDEQPLVRGITCWTISRYAKWITEQPADKYLEPVLAKLLDRILDSNKKVQEAACSSLAILEEKAEKLLIPYLKPILDTLSKAFQVYQKKNVFILYDAIRTLSDAVESHLNNEQFINTILPPLIEKWNTISDDDKDLYPLLECLTGVAAALGIGFKPFALPVYTRCLKLIEQTLQKEQQRRPQDEEVEKEFIICSLDLISGMTEGLGAAMNEIVMNSNLLNLLYLCMKDTSYDVRQSSFGVVGDLASSCIGLLRTALNEYIPILIQNLSSRSQSVCNNASWALGEIAVQVGGDMSPYANDILKKIIPILNNTNSHQSLMENAAVTFGRIGLVCPDITAPYLSNVCENWCMALTKISNDTEREHAFGGLCALIRKNPQAVLSGFGYVVDAICSYDNPPMELKKEFETLLKGFKDGMGQQWSAYITHFPPELVIKLRENYNI
ncbi:hypothetical protein ABK040_002551 [Willaertia magna]